MNETQFIMNTKSVKGQVLKSMSGASQTFFTTKDIRRFIHIAQGGQASTFVNEQGYYCHALLSWRNDNLIERICRGKYRLTTDGCKYLEDKNAFNRELREKREERTKAYRKAYDERNEIAERKSNARMKWNDMLVGRTIIGMRRLNGEEMDESGWTENPMVILLDDGTFIVPQRDDEGNNGGVLYVQSKCACSTIYVER
mgnify:CR=1 FL=1|tara:strand:+ start:357 stop:953 length:597 start_codon:yes stop_codon:yes gene_type:complete